MEKIWIYHDQAQIETQTPGIITDTFSSPQLYIDGKLSPLNVFKPYLTKVYKNGEIFKGRLINSNNKTVTLSKGGNKITIRNYDSIVDPYEAIGSLWEGGILRYLTSEFKWNCEGNLTLETGELSLYAEIKAPFNFCFDELTLVSEKLKQRRMLLGGVSQEGKFKEYITFLLGKMELYEEKNYIPLLISELDLEKVYVLNLETSKVRLGYITTLSHSLPHCQVNVNSNGMFIGSVTFSEKRKGQELRFYLGKTTKVRAEINVAEEQIPVKDHVTHTKITVTGKIYGQGKVIARYHVGKREVIADTCHGKVNKGYLEFYPEKEISCSFTLA